MKILICGLPGAGKTTLANALAPQLSAVHWNGNDVRHHINAHLGFSLEDRLQQSRSMGWLADQVCSHGRNVVVDFICPTPETRDLFIGQTHPTTVIFLDKLQPSAYEDTNAMFVPPKTGLRVIRTKGNTKQILRRVMPWIQWVNELPQYHTQRHNTQTTITVDCEDDHVF